MTVLHTCFICVSNDSCKSIRIPKYLRFEAVWIPSPFTKISDLISHLYILKMSLPCAKMTVSSAYIRVLTSGHTSGKSFTYKLNKRRTKIEPCGMLKHYSTNDELLSPTVVCFLIFKSDLIHLIASTGKLKLDGFERRTLWLPVSNAFFHPYSTPTF